MSISTTSRKAGPFTGNGVTVSFPFAFKVFAAADVLVVRGEIATSAEVELTLGTHYTVTLNSNQDSSPGGTVNWIGTPLSSAFTLTLGSKVASTQPANFTNLGRFYPRVLNDALDRLTIVVQQLAEEVSRSVKVGFSGLVSPDELVDTITTAASTAATAAGEAAGSAEAAFLAVADAQDAVAAANAAIVGAVQKDGSVAMTGALVLPGNAVNALEAVPKQQMDAAVAGVGKRVAQIQTYQTGAVATGTGTFNANAVPQQTGGDQYLSVSIAPTDAGSTLLILVNCFLSNSSNGNNVVAALFQDSGADALVATAQYQNVATGLVQVSLSHIVTAGSTATRTFKVRCGGSAAGTTTFNGSGGSQFLGGVACSRITVLEILP